MAGRDRDCEPIAQQRRLLHQSGVDPTLIVPRGLLPDFRHPHDRGWLTRHGVWRRRRQCA